ncbi:hypothetical protein OIO90_000051 [Microbotryomycetes sp. JL221]|nr:hypothetical protein OIO90_000051 [Microbotryomycetes sp. JL221]
MSSHQQMAKLHKRQRERVTTTTTVARARATTTTRARAAADEETTRRRRETTTTERRAVRPTTTARERATTSKLAFVFHKGSQVELAPDAYLLVLTRAATRDRVRNTTTATEATRRAAASTTTTTTPAAQATTATPARAVASSAALSSARTTSSRSPSASAAAGAAGSSTKEESSGIGGGAIAGIIIALVALAALVGAFFWWRKKKNGRASIGRGSGSTLVGSHGGANGGFKKHRDDDSELFGNSLMSGGGAYGEKVLDSTDSYGFYGGNNSPVQPAWNGGQQSQQWDAPSPYQSQVPHSPPTVPAQAFQASMKALPSAGVAATAFGAGATAAALANSRHQEIEQREMQQHHQQQQAQQQQQQPQQQLQQQQAAGNNAGPFSEFPGQGAVHVVKRTFEPGLEDELVLLPGNRVQLLIRYDDGWALGINLDSDQSPPAKGVFPFDCLGEALGTSTQQPLSTIMEQDSRPASLASVPVNNGFGYKSPVDSSTVVNSPPAQLSYLSNESPTGFNAPQLPEPKRSDSPIDLSSPTSPRETRSTPSPTLMMPSIQISDQTTGVSHEYFSPPPMQSQQFFAEQQQQQPPLTNALPRALQSGRGEGNATTESEKKSRRTSSLVASQDRDLFLAMGEVLSRDDVKH